LLTFHTLAMTLVSSFIRTYGLELPNKYLRVDFISIFIYSNRFR
jgi:hypothetical protein